MSIIIYFSVPSRLITHLHIPKGQETELTICLESIVCQISLPTSGNGFEASILKAKDSDL